jgi:Leucine-rich repeat (LRR) protein
MFSSQRLMNVEFLFASCSFDGIVLLQVNNIFHLLPTDLCVRILKMLPPTSAISAILASKVFAIVGRSPSFWEDIVAPIRFDPTTLPSWVSHARVTKALPFPFRKVHIMWFLPSSVATLSHLRTLNLSSSDMGEIPFHGIGGSEFIQQFSKLPSLEELHLPKHALSFTQFMPRDFSFEPLARLTRLDAVNTGFSTIHAHCLKSCTNLVHLNIAFNHIQFFVHEANARNYPSLHVNDCIATHIPHALSQLTYLDMSDSMYLTADDIIEFASKLKTLDTLCIGSPDAPSTTSLSNLSCLTKLRVLDIKAFDLGESGEEDLASFTALTSLNLADTYLTFMKPWSCKWASFMTGLRSINVSGSMGFQHLSHVVDKLQHCILLQELSVGGMQNLQSGVPQLRPFLHSVRHSFLKDTLLSLDISYSYLTISQSHASIMSELISLEVIVLDSNYLTQDAWGALCTCTKLRKLSARSCGIQTLWCENLTRMVNLSSLNLEDNHIVPSTMLPIVKVLVRLSTLLISYSHSTTVGGDEAKLLKLLALRN